MNTAKHLRGSNLLPLPKRRFRFWNKQYLSAILLAALLGTYLDFYFVENQIYGFPIRPFPKIFPINIAFTLIVLPIFVFFYLTIMRQVTKWGRVGLIIFFSLLMPIFEKLSEVCGLFVHSTDWKHIYTFIGYLLFLTIIYAFDVWMEYRKG